MPSSRPRIGKLGGKLLNVSKEGNEQAHYGTVLGHATGLGPDAAVWPRLFSKSNLYQMRNFYLAFRHIFQTPSAKLELENRQAVSFLSSSNPRFSLPWSHYVRLLKVENPEARQFYETEALRGGWSVRQLDRQISTLFYERTLASRNKGAMLKKGAIPQDGER